MNSLRSPAPNAGFLNFGSKANAPKANGGIMNSFKMLAPKANANANTTASNMFTKAPSTTVIILIIALLVLFTFIATFYREVQNGFRVLYQKIKVLFGATEPALPPPVQEQDVNNQPQPPQNREPSEAQKMVEKILPGIKQVFNISKNSYSYYDAEPLCKALGSELATYEQVKQAYAQGADWCNYGWVKGQMAVFPTQQATWEQLQSGPQEQRNACGRPGLNGGFFDNPELKYGVNCFGTKPEQKEHDATAVASGDGAPLSVGGLEFEKKIAKYRGEASSIAVLPWNKNTWSV
jgi:hypothetical protein